MGKDMPDEWSGAVRGQWAIIRCAPRRVAGFCGGVSALTAGVFAPLPRGGWPGIRAGANPADPATPQNVFQPRSQGRGLSRCSQLARYPHGGEAHRRALRAAASLVPRSLAPPVQVSIAVDPAILLPQGHVAAAVDIKIQGIVKLRRNRPGPLRPEIAPLATQLRPGAVWQKIPNGLELRRNQELSRVVDVPVLLPHRDDGPTP